MGVFSATWKYLKSNLQKRRFDLSPGQTDLAFDRLRHRDITLLSAFRGKELFWICFSAEPDLIKTSLQIIALKCDVLCSTEPCVNWIDGHHESWQSTKPCSALLLGRDQSLRVHSVIARHGDRSLRVHSVIARHWDRSLRVHSVIARSTDNWQRNFEEHSSLYWKQKKNSILLWKAHVILFCPSFWLLSYFWRLTHHLRLVKRRPNH